ncbi:MAG: hypothetical protein ACTSRZ_06170 [Promethearchaeota archaeon]
MVVGVVVYKFELNLDDQGEIEPEFRILCSELTEEYEKTPLYEIISLNELFSIYYNHTAGYKRGFHKSKQETSSNFFVGRLKEAPYKVISYFKESIDEGHYLTITIFKIDEDSELFEDIIQILAGKMDVIFDKMAKGNMRSISFVKGIEQEMKQEIRRTLFQIERLSNLTKTQKVGLLYIGPERERTLQLLRQGPISRTSLTYELSIIKENPNIDQVLRPFTELNLIRRDWAKGVKDKKSGIIWGQGEYIFLVKDVILTRQPPKNIIDQMKKNESIGAEYLKRLEEFYSSYLDNTDFHEESKLLASFILNSDVYDLLALLASRTYAKEKMPKVLSEFSDMNEILKQLEEAKVITIIEDDAKREWVCLLAEIVPIAVFPEYMVNAIQERLIKKDEDLVNLPEKDPLTLEVARKALELLEASYDEKIEFF